MKLFNALDITVIKDPKKKIKQNAIPSLQLFVIPLFMMGQHVPNCFTRTVKFTDLVKIKNICASFQFTQGTDLLQQL